MEKGQLVTWKDDRGFGFIKPEYGRKEVFLHISALKEASRRPQVGDIIFYERVTEKNGKTRASKAFIQGVAPRSLPAKRRTKKRGFLEVVIGVGMMAVFALSFGKFNGSRFPSIMTSITKPGCNIKGNISLNSGNKIYHLPGMEDYESTIIDPTKGEKWFCTESEAIANGWRKAPR